MADMAENWRFLGLHGICAVITSSYRWSDLTLKEVSRLHNYLEENLPPKRFKLNFVRVEAGNEYCWEPGLLSPRLEWLDQEILKTPPLIRRGKFKHLHLAVFDGTSAYVIPHTDLDQEIVENQVQVLGEFTDLKEASEACDDFNNTVT